MTPFQGLHERKRDRDPKQLVGRFSPSGHVTFWLHYAAAMAEVLVGVVLERESTTPIP